jgi:hypothetical protein
MCNISSYATGESSLSTSESSNYDPIFHNIAIRENQPHAILIVAFNRPNYLDQVIKSLEKNHESQSLPFYFFLDGGPHSKQQENIALIDASTIKNKTIIARNCNYGCPKNHIDAKRFMFDWCGFDKVVVIEEDLVVSPSFIYMNLELHRWAKENFSNVGVVQCWSYCRLTRKEKLKNLNKVEDSGPNWWSFVGYCLDNEVWTNIRSILYHYESFVDQIPQTEEFDKQRSKPSVSFIAPNIRSWMRTIMPERIPMLQIPGKKIFPSTSDFSLQKRYAMEDFSVSQDTTTGFALWMAGYIKIRTVVNRARHVGEEGITVNKEIFDKTFQSIRLHAFPHRDRMIHDFRLTGRG